MYAPMTHSRTRPDTQPTPWGDRAACRGMDSEPFFSSDPDTQHQALRTCQECPVRMECLMQALAVEEEHGVWGGMLEADRRALVRGRQETRRARELVHAHQTLPAPTAVSLLVTTQPARRQAARLAA